MPSGKVSAKDIRIAPITAAAANEFVRRHHYSGKVVPNSTLHLGVRLNGVLHGAMQFGPPINKKATLPLVAGTEWHGMLELNRMVFTDALPKNSESRAIGVACRMIKKRYKSIKWIVSWADATSCGDGTIYRASGFELIKIKKNSQLRRDPVTGKAIHAMTAYHNKARKEWQSYEPIEGFQICYIKFIDPDYRRRLTVETVPFGEIAAQGAGMYKGEKTNAGEISDGLAPPGTAAV